MKRSAKIILSSLYVINAIELLCGIGIVALSRFPKAEMSDNQVETAISYIASSSVMIVGIFLFNYINKSSQK